MLKQSCSCLDSFMLCGLPLHLAIVKKKEAQSAQAMVAPLPDYKLLRQTKTRITVQTHEQDISATITIAVNFIYR